MKKSVVIAIAVGLIGLMTVAAYASGTRGSFGRGAHGSNEAQHGAYGHGGKCGGHGRHGDEAHHTAPQPGQEPIPEDKAKEAAETFIAKYLSGYSIETIEQEEQCPCYLVTVKQASGVTLQVMIDAYSGEAHHLFIPAEEEAATQ
jgi:hypothetical protein